MLRGAVLHQAVLVQVLAAAVRAAEGVAVWHWTGTQANTQSSYTTLVPLVPLVPHTAHAVRELQWLNLQETRVRKKIQLGFPRIHSAFIPGEQWKNYSQHKECVCVTGGSSE